MKMIILTICFTLFGLNSLYSQTKADLVDQIKLIDREKEERGWIKTELVGTSLHRVYRIRVQKLEWTKECSFDMKKIEAVILRYDKEFSSWHPVILFKGNDNYEIEVDDDGSRRSLTPDNEKSYYFFKEKAEAVKAQKLFINLAQLCGAKLIIKK